MGHWSAGLGRLYQPLCIMTRIHSAKFLPAQQKTSPFHLIPFFLTIPSTRPLSPTLPMATHSATHSPSQNPIIPPATSSPIQSLNTSLPPSSALSSATSRMEWQRSLKTFVLCVSKGREGAVVVSCGRSVRGRDEDESEEFDRVEIEVSVLI